MDKKEQLVKYWKERGIITDTRVLGAFLKVNREEFMPEDLRKEAYADIALPIGFGATISQPTTVMIMTQALDVRSGMKVLEIGSGSGYQSAILSYLANGGIVYSVEIIAELVSYAQKNIQHEKIQNVKIIQSDGSIGLPNNAPYDRIIVTAASPELLESLLSQLSDNGIMVIPIREGEAQTLYKITKKGQSIEKQNLGLFMFVPLQGEKGLK